MKNNGSKGTPVSKQEDQLLVQGDQLHSALKTHQDEIGIKFNKAAALRAEITKLRQADTAFKACRALRLEKLTPAQAAVAAEARRFILHGKHLLRDPFGPAWNLAWAQVGFDSGNLQVPRDFGQRVALVERMGAWFREHPEQENALLGATAEKAAEIHARFTAVRHELGNQAAEERRCSEERARCRAALRKRIRGVTVELGWVLADDDARWRAFGLTPPATVKTRRREAQAAKARAAAQPALEVVDAGTPAGARAA